MIGGVEVMMNHRGRLLLFSLMTFKARPVLFKDGAANVGLGGIETF